LIEKEDVSHLCAAPTILITMSTWPGASEVKMKRKLKIMTAGAPPAPAIIRNMEAIGADITHTYGLTEVYGPHSVCAWQPAWETMSMDEMAIVKSRQGVPYIMTHFMDVVDPVTMKPVPRDGKTMGEIVMRGNNVMTGYYKDPEATEEAFEGGWFHSGDLAVMHPDGYAQIMDRKKDIIISGGENISTVEVESVIYSHPDVQEVAVIPVPDEKWGEVPKAYVVLKAGKTTSAEDIIAYTKEHLARFKAPKYIEFGDLPKTATGKIQKFKLRDKEWEGKKRIG
jgi:fatty-acyl-CoA synthase